MNSTEMIALLDQRSALGCIPVGPLCIRVECPVSSVVPEKQVSVKRTVVAYGRL